MVTSEYTASSGPVSSTLYNKDSQTAQTFDQLNLSRMVQIVRGYTVDERCKIVRTAGRRFAKPRRSHCSNRLGELSMLISQNPHLVGKGLSIEVSRSFPEIASLERK